MLQVYGLVPILSARENVSVALRARGVDAGRGRRAGARGAGPLPHRRPRRPPGRGALRRPDAARGAGPRAVRRRGGAARRRAHQRARRGQPWPGAGRAARARPSAARWWSWPPTTRRSSTPATPTTPSTTAGWSTTPSRCTCRGHPEPPVEPPVEREPSSRPSSRPPQPTGPGPRSPTRSRTSRRPRRPLAPSGARRPAGDPRPDQRHDPDPARGLVAPRHPAAPAALTTVVVAGVVAVLGLRRGRRHLRRAGGAAAAAGARRACRPPGASWPRRAVARSRWPGCAASRAASSTCCSPSSRCSCCSSAGCWAAASGCWSRTSAPPPGSREPAAVVGADALTAGRPGRRWSGSSRVLAGMAGVPARAAGRPGRRGREAAAHDSRVGLRPGAGRRRRCGRGLPQLGDPGRRRGRARPRRARRPGAGRAGRRRRCAVAAAAAGSAVGAPPWLARRAGRLPGRPPPRPGRRRRGVRCRCWWPRPSWRASRSPPRSRSSGGPRAAPGWRPAPRCASTSTTDAEPALELTRRLDPDGRWLMAGVLVPGEGSVPARRAFLDLSRYERGAGRLPRGTPAAGLATVVDELVDDESAAGTVGPVAGTEVVATVSGVSRRLERADAPGGPAHPARRHRRLPAGAAAARGRSRRRARQRLDRGALRRGVRAGGGDPGSAAPATASCPGPSTRWSSATGT